MFFNYLNKLSIFLIIMIPSFLVTGPFLADLSISIVGLIFIFMSISNGYYKKIFLNKFTFVFLLFYSIIIISSLNSIDSLFSLESSLFYFRFLFFVLCVLAILERYPNFQLNFLRVLCFLFFIICFDATIELIRGYNILGYSSIKGRIAGLFGDEWIIGSFLVRLFPLLVFLGLKQYTKLPLSMKILFILTSMITIFIIIFSGERTALLLLIIYFLFTVSLIIIKNFRPYKLLLIPIVLCLFLLPKFINENSFNRITDRIGEHTSLNINENVYYSMYKTAYLMFLDKPVLGHGPKLYRISCEDYEIYTSDSACNTHPHSTYFQLLAEIGLIGVLFIFSLFIYLFIKIFQIFFSKDTLSESLANLSIVMCPFLTLWPLTPSGSFFNNWLSIVYFLPIGFYLYNLSSNK
jgi:O-antigen ligase